MAIIHEESINSQESKKVEFGAIFTEFLRNELVIITNKRAQGRSPEEKVKGNSGANYREPQGHNLNNFGRGPFDDVIY